MARRRKAPGHLQLRCENSLDERVKIRAALRKLRDSKPAPAVDEKLAPWQRSGLRRTQSANQYDSVNRSWRTNRDLNANERRHNAHYRHKMEPSSSTVETNNNITDLQKLHQKWAADSGNIMDATPEPSRATSQSQGSMDSNTAQQPTSTSATTDPSMQNGHKNGSASPQSEEANQTSLEDQLKLLERQRHLSRATTRKGGRSRQVVAGHSSPIVNIIPADDPATKAPGHLQLDENRDFEERRQLRASMRELRAKIKEDRDKPKTSESDDTAFVSSDHNSAELEVTNDGKGAISYKSDLPVSQGEGQVKVTLRRARTPSDSAVEHRDTIMEVKRRSDSGSEYTEKNTISTKKTLRHTGSVKLNTTATSMRKISQPNGEEYEETDIHEEEDEKSLSKDTHTLRSKESHIVKEGVAEEESSKPDSNRRVKFDRVKEGSDGERVGEETAESKQRGMTDEEALRKYVMFVPSTEEPKDTTEHQEMELFPEVVEALSDLSVTNGESATFSCRLSAPPGAGVHWYHGQKLVNPSEDFQQTFDGSFASLTIAEVFPEDEGKYRCQVKSQNGVAETAAELAVKVSAPCKAPVIEDKLGNMTVKEGDKVTLKCSISGLPAPNITWYHEKKLLKNIADFRQTYKDGCAKLVLQEVLPEDDGTYTCRAENEAGSAEVSCHVMVEESVLCVDNTAAPEFEQTLAKVTSKPGATVKLACVVSGAPQPEIRWYHGNDLLHDNSRHTQRLMGKDASLLIRDVKVEDSGGYRCVATNSLGEVSCSTFLKVEDEAKSRPVFGQQLEDGTATDGKPYSMECIITAGKDAFITWYKNGRALRGVDFKQTYRDGVAKLDIREVFPEDAGRYECVARNAQGESKTFCNVKVMDGSPRKFGSPNKLPGSPSKVSLLRDKIASATRSNEHVRRKSPERFALTRSCSFGGMEPERSYKLEDQKKTENNLDNIHDENQLYRMLDETSGFEERRRIRLRIKELRQKKTPVEKVKAMSPTSKPLPERRVASLREEGVTYRAMTAEKSSDGRLKTTATTRTVDRDGSSSTTIQTKQVTHVSPLGSQKGNGLGSRNGSKPVGAISALKNIESSFKIKPQPNSTPENRKPLGIQRSASSIKALLLEWCKANTAEYGGVEIRNFGNSWNNGMAFCALIHHFYPDAFDFNSLDPRARRQNFELAFDTAEKYGIAQLLDVEDMVRMQTPDWKCVFTYVQQFYRKFRSHDANMHGDSKQEPKPPPKVLKINRD